MISRLFACDGAGYMVAHQSVDILLSTYNGEKYLPAQLNSILHQTFQNWRILAYDDGSSDKTCRILRKYSSEDSRIQLVAVGPRTGIPSKNFLHLLSQAEAPYVMFCDQDDVWELNKIEMFLQRAQEMEQKKVPLLIYSDLHVVDADLHIIDDSYFHDMRIDPYRTRVNQLLVQNVVTGCAMMVNRSLVDMTIKYGFADDDRVIMHDWLLGLLADCFGEISYLPKKTVLYRQHGTNQVGAHRFSVRVWATKKENNIKSLERSILQAQCVTERTRNLLPYLSEEQKRKRAIVSQYAGIMTDVGWKRPVELIRGQYWKSNLARRLGQLLLIGQAFHYAR